MTKRSTDLALIAMGFTGPEDTLILACGFTQSAHGGVATDGSMTVRHGVFAAGDMRVGQSLVARGIGEGQRRRQPVFLRISAGQPGEHAPQYITLPSFAHTTLRTQ